MNIEFEIPPLVQIKYLQHRLVDLQDIEFALEKGSYDAAERVGHQIKGNAFTFKFNSLEDLGKRLEAAAALKNSEAILSEVLSLRAAICKLLIELVVPESLD